MYDTNDDQMNFFTNFLVNDYDGNIEDVVFTETDLQSLKEKDVNLCGKGNNKYYHCKEMDAKMYM